MDEVLDTNFDKTWVGRWCHADSLLPSSSTVVDMYPAFLQVKHLVDPVMCQDIDNHFCFCMVKPNKCEAQNRSQGGKAFVRLLTINHVQRSVTIVSS